MAVYSLRVNSSICLSAPQPSAVYTPARGAHITGAQLLLSHAASQLLILSSHSSYAGATASTSGSAGMSLQPTKLSLTALDVPAASSAGTCQQLQPTHSCILSSPGPRHDAVTCQLLAGGDICAPSLLVQARPHANLLVKLSTSSGALKNLHCAPSSQHSCTAPRYRGGSLVPSVPSRWWGLPLVSAAGGTCQGTILEQ